MNDFFLLALIIPAHLGFFLMFYLYLRAIDSRQFWLNETLRLAGEIDRLEKSKEEAKP